MLICTAVDACTKSGFGNVESICDFNVVRRAGKSEYFIGIASHFCCCCCFWLLFSFLGVSSPWPLTLFASSFQPAVGLGVACVFAVLACHTWVWISPCPCCYNASQSSVSCRELQAQTPCFLYTHHWLCDAELPPWWRWWGRWASLPLMTMCQAGYLHALQLLLSGGLVGMTLGVRTWWSYCSTSWESSSPFSGDCCVAVPWAGSAVWPL